MIAIDLGSNSFRCIEYDCATKQFGRSFERIVKTADKMHETGIISDGAVERVSAALKEADRTLDFTANTVKAVTTHAMRMASNAGDIIANIKKQSGVDFQIISSDDEAYYTLIAVEARLEALQLESSHFVLIDVGGGSTEIIFYKDGQMESQSFPIGIVTTAQFCDDNRDIHSYLDGEFQDLDIYVKEYYKRAGKPNAFVATAGTPTTMAAYLLGMNYSDYDVDKINGYRLSFNGTQQALAGLMALSEEKRGEIVGVGRESLILSGIVIIQKLYNVLGFDEAVVIDDGVREGVAIDYCKNN
ncbi:MAG: phosphatase [Helicobacteraceae bacterium]|jgi:exopolyphosphatase/guanosine-5'-triphosphate,3'-diphosphate pyrophosphatase|nr:phosphatase [Helicobacteraceae bacterium]